MIFSPTYAIGLVDQIVIWDISFDFHGFGFLIVHLQAKLHTFLIVAPTHFSGALDRVLLAVNDAEFVGKAHHVYDYMLHPLGHLQAPFHHQIKEQGGQCTA